MADACARPGCGHSILAHLGLPKVACRGDCDCQGFLRPRREAPPYRGKCAAIVTGPTASGIVRCAAQHRGPLTNVPLPAGGWLRVRLCPHHKRGLPPEEEGRGGARPNGP